MPPGVEGELLYNADYKVMQFCDGTNWISMVGGSAGGSLADGDKGDVTVSGVGATWSVDAGAISYAKIQDVSATSRLLGRASAGAGTVEEITIGTGLALAGSTLSATGPAAAERPATSSSAAASAHSSRAARQQGSSSSGTRPIIALASG